MAAQQEPPAGAMRPAGAGPARLAQHGRRYRRCAVGFVDTLGAKAFSDSELFLNALGFMVDLQKRVASTRRGEPAIRTTYFSDNIGASVIIEDAAADQQKRLVCQLLRLLAGIQYFYLHDFGILCRGGVATGPCYHDDSVIFGPALVAAYQMGTADSPRIVVSDDVAAIAGDDVVPLHPAEPIRSRDAAAAVSLRSIDFLRAELPHGPTWGDHIRTLEDAVATGAAEVDPDDAPTRAKWVWTQRKLAALTAGGPG